VCVCESAEGQGWFQWWLFIQMAKNLRVPQKLSHFLATWKDTILMDCLTLQTDALQSFETTTIVYQSVWRNIQRDSDLQYWWCLPFFLSLLMKSNKESVPLASQFPRIKPCTCYMKTHITWNAFMQNVECLDGRNSTVTDSVLGHVRGINTVLILLWIASLLHNVLLLKYTKRYYITVKISNMFRST